MANTLDELMTNSHKILTGPHDRRIEDIIAYERQWRAKLSAGKKPSRSHVAEEDISPKIMEAFKKMLPPKKVYRRF